jgi:hypothetical protein
MHYKTNRLNHDFQIAYFIAGSCQTADAAWSILSDLKEDRSNAVKSFKAYNLRDRAKIKRAEQVIAKFIDPHTGNVEPANEDDPEYMEALADIEELRALSETVQKNYDAGLAELAFIQKCMDKLEPLRKFAHLPDAEANEAAQYTEWKLQLVHTAQNHLLSTNHIPHDHWDTMRMHPAFEAEILPAVSQFMEVKALAASGNKDQALRLTSMLIKKNYDLPPMLPAPAPEHDVKLLETQGESNARPETKPASPDYGPLRGRA